MKNKAAFLLKIAITVLLFYFVFHKIDFKKCYDILKSADVASLSLAVLVFVFTHVLCATRWKIFLNLFKFTFSFLRLMYIYAVGLFFNLALPTGVGGDFVKFYLAAKETGGSYTLAFASVILDRNAGLIALSCIATFFCAMQPVIASLRLVKLPLLLWLSGVTAGLFLVNLFLFNPRFYAMISKLLHRFPSVAMRLDIVSKAFSDIWRSKAELLKTILLSFGNDLLLGVMGWLIARSVHVNLPVFYFLVLMPAISLIAMIPIAPGGIGIREGAFGLLFSQLGVDPEKSVLMGLLTSFIQIVVPSIPGGLVYVLFKRRGEISGMEEAEAVMEGKITPS